MTHQAHARLSRLRTVVTGFFNPRGIREVVFFLTVEIHVHQVDEVIHPKRFLVIDPDGQWTPWQEEDCPFLVRVVTDRDFRGQIRDPIVSR